MNVFFLNLFSETAVEMLQKPEKNQDIYRFRSEKIDNLMVRYQVSVRKCVLKDPELSIPTLSFVCKRM